MKVNWNNLKEIAPPAIGIMDEPTEYWVYVNGIVSSAFWMHEKVFSNGDTWYDYSNQVTYWAVMIKPNPPKQKRS